MARLSRSFWLAPLALAATLGVPRLFAQGSRPLSHDAAPPLAGQALASPLLSGGAVRAEIELLPPDLFPVLNGNPAPPQAAHDGSDVRLVAQVRFTGSGVLGSRVGGEAVPYLRVRAVVTNERTGASLTAALRPTVGLEEGWHYASNLDLPGDPSTDTYRVVVRIAPPALLRTEPDFAVSGTLFDTAAEITVSSVRADLREPSAPGSFPVSVREGLTS